MYKIYAQNDSNTEILLYSLIDGGYTASKLIKQLKEANSENITLRINSDGGEVFEGIALYNYLKNKNVHVIVDGICASAASVVAMSGKVITMMRGSMMMIHNPWTVAIGDAVDLREQADILDKLSALTVDIYSTKAKITREEITNLMNNESWLTAQEALSYGFADEIDETLPPEKESDSASESGSQDIVNRMSAYDDGVNAERERLRELDELNAPGREAMINEAKYVTCKRAQDIAIALLKAERPRNAGSAVNAPVNVNNLPLPDRTENDIKSMADIIAKIRRNG